MATPCKRHKLAAAGCAVCNGLQERCVLHQLPPRDLQSQAEPGGGIQESRAQSSQPAGRRFRAGRASRVPQCRGPRPQSLRRRSADDWLDAEGGYSTPRTQASFTTRAASSKESKYWLFNAGLALNFAALSATAVTVRPSG